MYGYYPYWMQLGLVHFSLSIFKFIQLLLTVINFIIRSDEEFREWKQRLSDLEGACSELRSVRSRLEGRISELEQLLAAEVSNSQSLSEALERETESRVATQKQLHAMQQRHPGSRRFGKYSYFSYCLLSVHYSLYCMYFCPYGTHV